MGERKSDGGQRIIDALDEIIAWTEGEGTLHVHLPDGTEREMTAAEYRAFEAGQRAGFAAGCAAMRERAASHAAGLARGYRDASVVRGEGETAIAIGRNFLRRAEAAEIIAGHIRALPSPEPTGGDHGER